MPIYAAAGAKLYIGDVYGGSIYGGSLTVGNFTTATNDWTEIKPLETMGKLGGAAESIQFNSYGDDRVLRLKGTRNPGDFEFGCGLDFSDPGQQALLAAEATDHNYEFRLVFDDAPPGGTPSERLFVALIMGVEESLDEANAVIGIAGTLALNSNVVRINAAGP